MMIPFKPALLAIPALVLVNNKVDAATTLPTAAAPCYALKLSADLNDLDGVQFVKTECFVTPVVETQQAENWVRINGKYREEADTPDVHETPRPEDDLGSLPLLLETKSETSRVLPQHVKYHQNVGWDPLYPLLKAVIARLESLPSMHELWNEAVSGMSVESFPGLALSVEIVESLPLYSLWNKTVSSVPLPLCGLFNRTVAMMPPVESLPWYGLFTKTVPTSVAVDLYEASLQLLEFGAAPEISFPPLLCVQVVDEEAHWMSVRCNSLCKHLTDYHASVENLGVYKFLEQFNPSGLSFLQLGNVTQTVDPEHPFVGGSLVDSLHEIAKSIRSLLDSLSYTIAESMRSLLDSRYEIAESMRSLFDSRYEIAESIRSLIHKTASRLPKMPMIKFEWNPEPFQKAAAQLRRMLASCWFLALATVGLGVFAAVTYRRSCRDIPEAPPTKQAAKPTPTPQPAAAPAPQQAPQPASDPAQKPAFETVILDPANTSHNQEVRRLMHTTYKDYLHRHPQVPLRINLAELDHFIGYNPFTGRVHSLCIDEWNTLRRPAKAKGQLYPGAKDQYMESFLLKFIGPMYCAHPPYAVAKAAVASMAAKFYPGSPDALVLETLNHHLRTLAPLISENPELFNRRVSEFHQEYGIDIVTGQMNMAKFAQRSSEIFDESVGMNIRAPQGAST